MTEESAFAAALEIKTLAERAAFLDSACAGNAELRQRVDALLQAHYAPVGALDKLAVEPADTGAFQPRPSALDPTAVLDVAGSAIGPYKLLQKLGEGGMGAVYMAEQEQPVKRRVALKIIKAGMDTAHVIARFEQERQALAMMDHPSIAKVLEAGTTGTNRPYFVMELVKGIPITKYCDQEHLTPKERLELFIPVCQAVQHAHQKGIIHRDLKPSNVLIALYDGKPIPKVIDFGVAKATAQKLTEKTMFTEVGQIVGTVEYMAPEQAELNNLDIDTRADIYSLGVILYELLTGSPPFTSKQLRGAAFAEMLRMIREVEPPKPSTKLSSSKDLPSIAAKRKLEPKKLSRLVHGDLDWIVMKCLEKERSRRYESANGLALELQRYLHDEPVLAGPPSAAYRLRKFVRRNRGPVVAAALVALALMAGITGTTIGLVQARAEAREKEIARADEEQQRRDADAQRREAVAEKDRAVKAENAARTMATIAQEVNRFLQVDLLGQADIANQPFQQGAVGRNRNITVGELLDRAAKAIEGKFARQPMTEAAIRRTIGATYAALGRHADAERHLERAAQLYSDHLGAEHPETIRSKRALAWLYFWQGDYRKVEPLFKEMLDLPSAKTNASQRETLENKNALAVVVKHLGRIAEAEMLYREVVEQSEKQFGNDHAGTLTAKLNLAGLLTEEEKYAEAEQLLDEVCSRYEKRNGPDHPSTMHCKHSLVWLYYRTARYAQAERLAKQVLEMREQKLGADHPDTLISRGTLAVVYWGTDQLDKSIPIMEQVLSSRRAKLGDTHAYTLNAAGDLAANYRDAGRLDEALKLVEEWLPRCQTLGTSNPAVQYVMDQAVSIYDRRGEPAKGEPMLREMLKIAKETQGADSLDYGRRLASLGDNLLRQKKPEAEALLREGLRILESKQPDHHKAFLTRSLLGGALLLQEKYAEAEPLLLQGYEGLKQRQDKMYAPNRRVVLREALERLVQLYESTGMAQEAAKWRKEWEAAKAAPKPASQP
jgi:non-specific serine/threonine protein kinase/serine/threonine-protein kinase